MWPRPRRPRDQAPTPRAQRFLLNDERLAPVFAIAAERRVPILIHAGRGLPPIAADLAHLVDEYADAQLILAHAGISPPELGHQPTVFQLTGDQLRARAAASTTVRSRSASPMSCQPT